MKFTSSFAMAWFCALSSHAAVHPLTETMEGLKDSYYTPKIKEIMTHWPPKGIPTSPPPDSLVWERGLRHPENDTYVGAIHRVWIKAPIKTVTAILDNFEDYPSRAENLKHVKVKDRDENRFTTSWEIKSVTFLASNTRYDSVYWTDEPNAHMKVYRYQLKKGNNLNHADGLVVIEEKHGITQLTGLDFFDAQLGIAKGLARTRIWIDSFNGYVRGDLGLKLKAENPEWTNAQIIEKTEELLKKFQAKPVEYLESFSWEGTPAH